MRIILFMGQIFDRIVNKLACHVAYLHNAE